MATVNFGLGATHIAQAVDSACARQHLGRPDEFSFCGEAWVNRVGEMTRHESKPAFISPPIAGWLTAIRCVVVIVGAPVASTAGR